MAQHSPPPRGLGSAHRVGSAELFFDLVFVFAFTQVTTLLGALPTPVGFARGGIMLMLLWWVWGSFAWLTNAREADSTAMRLVLFAAMAGMLVVGLAVPNAFGSGALLVAIGITFTRIVWVVAYRLASKHDFEYSAAVRRLAVGAVITPVILIIGAIAGEPYQVWIWLIAVVVDFVSPIVARPTGWKVDPAHFAERYGLIIIIALGEAIVAIGLATAGSRNGLPGISAIVGAMLGLVIAAAMWTLYFAHLAETAEHSLNTSDQLARTLIARDAYTYAHLIPVAGIVMAALGAKEALGHPDDSALPVIIISLSIGGATYLAGVAAIAYRTTKVMWTSAWVVALVLALLGISALPSWRHGQSEVPILGFNSVTALAIVAVALIVPSVLKPARWRRGRLPQSST